MADTFERDETPNADSNHKMLNKIRKLLAKASAEGCTDAEREMLTAKAADLMAKYGIDRARAMAAGTDGDEMSMSPYCFYDATHYEQAALMYWIAEALGCQALINTQEADPDYDSTGLTVIGYLSDVERAEAFFESLYLQMIHGAVRVDRCQSKSFMKGFTREVCDRIKAAENKARADEAQAGSSTALVLASREVAVKAAFKAEFPVVSHKRSRIDASGYAAGVAAGKSANLGGTAVGHQRAALAG